MRFTLLLLILLLASCTGGPMTRIDQEVSGFLRQRERETLGWTAPLDPQPIPGRETRPAAYKDIYNDDPATLNPVAEELPAATQAGPPATQPATLISAYEAISASINDPDAFDLEDALLYAVRNSREYRNRKEALFLTSIDLLIERHLWGPRFFDTISATVTGTPEAGDHDQALAVINELGVRQRLPYGGEVSARIVTSFVEQLRTEAGSTADDGQDNRLVLAGEIPLLRGAGQVAREDLIQAERDLVYAARQFERFRREFFVEIASRYYDLVRQQAGIDSLRRQVENFEWLSKRIEALADAGREPVFEVSRAQQQVLFARNNLLNAVEGYASSLDAFKIALGMSTTQKLAIKPSEIVIPEPEVDMSDSVTLALDLRLNLQVAADVVEDARRRANVAQNQTLPDLDLFAAVNVRTDVDRQRGGVDFEAGDSDYTAGAVFDVPLDRRVEELRYRQSLVELERTKRAYELEEDRVALEVRDSIRQMEQARFTLDLQEKNIEVAQKRLNGVLLRLRSLGPRDYIEAQDDLLEARNRRDEAVRDLRVSILNYLLATEQLRVSSAGQWLPPGKLVPPLPVEAMPLPGEMLRQSDIVK